MKKKIFLTGFVFLSFFVLAYTGVKYAFNENKQIKEEPKQIIANEFAIKELILILKNYSNLNSINAEFTTSLIGDDGNTEITSFEGKYIKDHKKLFIQSYNSKTIMNENYFIAIDDEEKMIFVEKPEFVEKNDFLNFGFLLDIDSLIHFPDSLIFYEKIDEKISKITVEIESGSYYKTEYFYNFKTKEIIKINMFPYEEVFNEAPEEGEVGENVSLEKMFKNGEVESKPLFLSIVYTKLVINDKINSSWFDESKIFIKQENKLITSNLFKNYEIEYEF